MPITISLSETPSRSWGPAAGAAAGAPAAGGGVELFGAAAAAEGVAPAEEATGAGPVRWPTSGASDAGPETERAPAVGAGVDRTEGGSPATAAPVAPVADSGACATTPMVPVPVAAVAGGGAAASSGPAAPAVWRERAGLVALGGWGGAAGRDGLQGPVPHGRGAAVVVAVAGRGQFGAGPAGGARLLPGRPPGAVLVGLAPVALALGEGPVVVAGA